MHSFLVCDQAQYASLQAENERLKEALEARDGQIVEDFYKCNKELAALQSKIDRVRGELEPLVREENAKYFTTDELSIFNRILDLLK